MLEKALFADVAPPEGLSPEEQAADTALEVELVHLIQEVMIPALGAGECDDEAQWLFGLLQRATRLTVPSESNGSKQRMLAQESFKALVATVSPDHGSAQAIANSIGVDALLSSCRDILERFIADDAAATPPVALTASRVTEAAYVIRAMVPLITKERREVAAQLYPVFVRCIGCRAQEVKAPLIELLSVYQQLI